VTRRIDFPLAEWEFFTARGEVETGEIVEAQIRNVWTIRYDSGVTRIYGSGSDGPLWLRPQDVPPRVLRGDSHWPRTHPLEYRAMVQRGQKAIDLGEDEKVAARLAVLPEPEVRARPATLEEIPRGAKTIGVKATKNGFDVVATYSRGPRVDQYWRVSEISDTIMIRGRHADGRRFGAMWITKTSQKGAKAGVTSWEADTAYLMRDGIWTACGVTELSAYLASS
jgi:hypothetical protein